MKISNAIFNRVALIVLIQLIVCTLVFPPAVFAGGAYRGRGGVHTANRSAHRGGAHAGAHAGFQAGAHAGAHAGYHQGYHHGYHNGWHAGMHHGGMWHVGVPFAWHPAVHWHPIGFFLTTVAVTAVIVSVANHNYYYDSGIYYEKRSQSGQSGYVVVPAPVGAVVPTLPEGYLSFQTGSDVYFYYSGTYYVQDTDQVHYVVMQPPVGAVVPYLPDGYETRQVGSILYYIYNGYYYQPKSVDGNIAYELVPQP